MEGDALDLSMFPDNSFDLVLNLGPMYHFFNQKDKEQAVKESIRVTQNGGTCMFAYIPHASIMVNFCLKNGSMVSRAVALMDKEGRFKDTPAEVYASFHIEDFKNLFQGTDTTYEKNVATDTIAAGMSEYINSLSEKDYKAFLKWHFATCERLDQQGFSSHLLYICKKNCKKEQMIKNIACEKTR